jgi:hypothetical protein
VAGAAVAADAGRDAAAVVGALRRRGRVDADQRRGGAQTHGRRELMPYFPVDDQAAFHPKFIAAGNAAIGVWTRCGSWCKQHVSGGFVPAAIAFSIGGSRDVQKLVVVGLWEKVEGGYQFHDWNDQAGNFNADQEKARREKDRDRKRAQRAREKAEQVSADSPRDVRADGGVTPAGVTGGVTALPSPVPSPRTTDTRSSSVPETGASADGRDDRESVVLAERSLGYLDIDDFGKVRTAIARATQRVPSPGQVVQIVATILGRASNPKDPTAVVISSVRNDWAEWQQFLDADVAS